MRSVRCVKWIAEIYFNINYIYFLLSGQVKHGTLATFRNKKLQIWSETPRDDDAERWKTIYIYRAEGNKKKNSSLKLNAHTMANSYKNLIMTHRFLFLRIDISRHLQWIIHHHNSTLPKKKIQFLMKFNHQLKDQKYLLSIICHHIISDHLKSL